MSTAAPTVHFCNPETGAYLYSGVPDQDPLDKRKWLIPAGATTKAPPAEREGFVRRFVDGAWGYSPKPKPDKAPVSPDVVTEEMVIAERWRRLSLGFNHDFGDERGIHQIGTTPNDLVGWDEVTKASHAAVLVGQPELPINITTNTGAVTVTAMEWQHVLLAAAAHRQPIFAASFALQEMSPIPLDYAADKHWP